MCIRDSSEGVHVYGAASMGALRAAELDAFGMHGVGYVYRAYADGVLEDDDEVAVAHAGAEHGFRALSDAMVDVRATLAAAVAAALRASAVRSERSASRRYASGSRRASSSTASSAASAIGPWSSPLASSTERRASSQ